jgi:hypothetical protein
LSSISLLPSLHFSALRRQTIEFSAACEA